MIICGFKCFLLASSLCLMAQTLLAGNLDIKNGKWKIAFNKHTQTIDYLYQETTLLKETFVQAINASGEVLKQRRSHLRWEIPLIFPNWISCFWAVVQTESK